MKKFYFLMMALLVSLSSMAWTVKFTNPDNWTEVAAYTYGGAGEVLGAWPGTAMTQDGDVWTITSDKGTPEKIIFNNNKKNGASQTGNLNFVDGATYDKLGVVGAIATTYTCYFDNSKSNWTSVYAYSYNGYSTPNWPGVELSKNGDGLYVFSFESTVDPAGTIVIFNDGVGGSAGNGQTANLAWEADATYDVNGKIGGEDPEIVAYQLYGNWDGGTNWTPVALTESNGIYTASKTVTGSCGFGIRGVDATDNQLAWINAADAADGAVVLDKVISVELEGAANFAIAPGEYTFTFDLAAMTLKVTGKGDEPTPQAELYLLGPAAGGWAPNKGVKLEGADGVFTWNANLTEKTFFGFATKLCEVWDGAEGINSFRYGAAEGDTATSDTKSIAEAGSYPMLFPCGTSWNLPEGLWIVKVDTKNLKLIVEKDQTGIEAIEAEEGVEAVYYNLQGVRVANPENGMYIRVAGKTASKVYIR